MIPTVCPKKGNPHDHHQEELCQIRNWRKMLPHHHRQKVSRISTLRFEQALCLIAALGEHSRKPGLLARLRVEWKTTEQTRHENIATGTELSVQRWGPPQSACFEMVMQYWSATRMKQHWEHIQAHDPKKFRHYMEKGYMEPIPTSWVQSGHLALSVSFMSTYETQAQERLYYLLSHGLAADGTKPDKQSPLNSNSISRVIIDIGEGRRARKVRLDAVKLAKYQSPGDVFQSDMQTVSRDYSAQVPHVDCAARKAALFELAEGIRKGTDHLETMLLIDVSDSMTWNPHQGIEGPSWQTYETTGGPINVVNRYDQTSTIRLVEHLAHRVLQHMLPRAQKEHPSRQGIPTATFSREGRDVGSLSASGFQGEWNSRIHLGGPARIMPGWQVVKNTYFERQRKDGHGRLDPKFGWQATPGMPKLSLLVFLGSKPNDMDEFQLELLGVTWAYVTIALVGMENCPYHHAYAFGLERVAQSNPRVGIYEMQGRVCERMVVEDLLASVYPVDPPQRSEILKPEFDLPWEGEAWIKPVAPPVDPPQYSEIKEFNLPLREELPKYSASQERTCAEK